MKARSPFNASLAPHPACATHPACIVTFSAQCIRIPAHVSAAAGFDGTFVCVASSSGGVSWTRLNIPRQPGSVPQDIRMDAAARQEIEAAAGLPVKLQLHKGRVSAIDMRPDTGNVLTAGLDGGIFVFNAAATPSGANVAPFKQGTGAVRCAGLRHVLLPCVPLLCLEWTCLLRVL